MYTIVGVITNSHGIKGTVKVFPYTFDNDRFNEYKEIYIGEEKEKVHIKSVSFQKNLVLLTFNEYGDINDILKFKDSELFIKTEDRKNLEEGNYYLGDKHFLDFLLMTDNQIRKLSNPVFNEVSFTSLTAFLRKYDCLIPPLMFQKNYAKL